MVAEAKKTRLEAAKTSADLDSVLLKCAPLQMQREQENTSAGQRTYRKLGTAETLEAWANYLDYRGGNGNESTKRPEPPLTTRSSCFKPGRNHITLRRRDRINSIRGRLSQGLCRRGNSQ